MPHSTCRKISRVAVGWTLAVVLALGGAFALAAAPPDTVRPKKLQNTGILYEHNAETGTEVVVTHGGEVWTGSEGRLTLVEGMQFDPATIRLVLEDDGLVIWSSHRTGLAIRTQLGVRFADGARSDVGVDAPVLDTRFGPEGRRLVVLLPGELIIVGGAPVQDEPIRITLEGEVAS